jgi:hypothetical protein
MPGPRTPSDAAKRIYQNIKGELKGMNAQDSADAVLSALADLIVATGGPDPIACRRVCELAINDLRTSVTMRHAQRTAAENLGRDVAAIGARLNGNG